MIEAGDIIIVSALFIVCEVVSFYLGYWLGRNRGDYY